MTLLGIGFLLGLAGIILPIAIHFFSNRRKVIQPWGAMRFLEEARPTWKRRSLRLENLLILLLRILAVAVLAIAFARPTLKSFHQPESAHELNLIVDASASTGLADRTGNRIYDEIIATTRDVLDRLPEETRVRFFLAGEDSDLTRLTAESERSTNLPGNRQAWLARLRETTPEGEINDWLSAMRSTLSTADSPPPKRRHLLVIADASEHGWPGGDTDQSDSPLWDEFSSEFRHSSIGIVPVGANHPGRRMPNLSIEKIETDTERIREDEPITISATVTNRGAVPSETARGSWREGDDRKLVAEGRIPSLEPGQSHRLELRRSYLAAGEMDIALELDIDRDAQGNDNRADITLTILDQLNVLICIDQPTDQIPDPAIRFSSWALASATGDPESIGFGDHSVPFTSNTPNDSTPFFKLQWITPGQIQSYVLDPISVIIWSVSDSSRLPAELASRLNSFVKRGGGLWIRPPFDADRTGFNRLFFPHVYGLAPAGLASGFVETPAENDDLIGLRPFRSDRTETGPAFTSLDDLQVVRHLTPLQPIPSSTNVLLEFEGGQPMLLQRSSGKGKVLLSMVDSHPGSGNLASSIGYVPYVQEILWHLGRANSLPTNRAPHSPGESSVRALGPVYLDRLDRRGKIAVVKQKDEAGLERFLKSLQAEETPSNSAPSDQVLEQKELFAWFLAFLLGLLVLEVIMTHHLLSRRRSLGKTV